MNTFSSFLFARPSFLEGVGRLVDFGDLLNEYNTSPSPALADYWALSADVCTVGSEIQHAIVVFQPDGESCESQQVSPEKIEA